VEGVAAAASYLRDQHNRHSLPGPVTSELDPIRETIGGFNCFRPVRRNNRNVARVIVWFREHGKDFREVARRFHHQGHLPNATTANACASSVQSAISKLARVVSGSRHLFGERVPSRMKALGREVILWRNASDS
jgi:hypothetical protein